MTTHISAELIADLTPASTIITALRPAARQGPHVARMVEDATQAAAEHLAGSQRALNAAARLLDDDTSQPEGLERQWDEQRSHLEANAAGRKADLHRALDDITVTLMKQARPVNLSAAGEANARADVLAVADNLRRLEEEIRDNPNSAAALWSTAVATTIEQTHDAAALDNLRNVAIAAQADRPDSTGAAAKALLSVRSTTAALSELDFIAHQAKKRFRAGFNESRSPTSVA